MKRLLSLLGISTVLAVAFMFTLTPPVVAATLPPVIPSPINILPSVVTGATKGYTTYDVFAGLLYKYRQTPEFWLALQKLNSGTASSTQIALVNSVKNAHVIPATKISPMVRGAAPLASYAVGIAVGNTVVDLLGVDGDGLVCSSSGAVFLGFVTGRDCGAFTAHQQAQVNAGIASGLSASVCLSSGVCQTWAGGQFSNATNQVLCWSRSGASFGMQVAFTSPPSNWYTLGAPNGTDPSCTTGTYYTVFTKSLWNSLGGVPSAFRPASQPDNVSLVETLTSDPERKFKCVVDVLSGASYTAFSEPFTEASSTWSPPVCPEIAPGDVPTRTTITEEGGGQTHEVLQEETTPEFQDHETKYPECRNGTCMLDLLKGSVSCFKKLDLCTDWFNDPDKATSYTCRYGSHLVALSECNVYAPTFKPDATTTGTIYGDPDGDPISNPTRTGTDKTTFGAPVLDPTKDRQCFPQGWAALNPVNWVFQPVKCAIEWAFVPRPLVVQSVRAGIDEDISTSTLGQAAAITSAFSSVFTSTASGCAGPPFRIQFGPGPLFGAGGVDETYYPFSACSEPMNGYASVFKTLTLWFMFITAQLASIRYVANIFGYSGIGKSVTNDAGESSVRFR